MLKGNAIVGQSGGPTSVINASLAGVIDGAKKFAGIKKLYGMNYGIEGFMQERLIDLSAQPAAVVKGLRMTPSSSLGSSRHKVKEEDFPRIMEVLKKYDVRYFFLIGGNDTMDTINRVEQYCRKNGYELTGVGIPKTVDNDLFGTDHTPGYASAARYNALSVMQGGILARDMQRVDKFSVYQTIGRDAGWLAAACAAGKTDEASAPHLIYTPELPFSKEDFLKDAAACVKEYGFVSVVCGEGIKYKDGTPVSASRTKDKFNNTEFGAMGGASAALNLHAMLREAYGWRGEFQITESLIMCAADRGVANDFSEAYRCGIEAVKLASKGESGYMVTMKRISNKPYRISYEKAKLSDVAVKAKPMPLDYLTADGNFVSKKFFSYLSPLIGDMPGYVRLKQKFANKSKSID
ncbi:MAG: diphosphate--fructose-6-phosphate 1-phosphotransferase [Spirochaetes bacterium]|nr:diphosphate--fructose-6-phosphate 1-phosphotransferase [Spirochaetota bacterium]